ncbi:hypothetical protein AGMMS49928_06440 [Spirochaetia bacterium]|nr:hypothetical protein AGMMS49928_06440 [Spirochaetia bacterium]
MPGIEKISLKSSSTFKDFYCNLQKCERHLIQYRKRIEESMEKKNEKPPIIDTNGRHHAP